MYQSTYNYVESRLKELKASNDGTKIQTPQGAGDALISLGNRIKPKSAPARPTSSNLNPSWAGR